MTKFPQTLFIPFIDSPRFGWIVNGDAHADLASAAKECASAEHDPAIPAWRILRIDFHDNGMPEAATDVSEDALAMMDEEAA